MFQLLKTQIIGIIKLSLNRYQQLITSQLDSISQIGTEKFLIWVKVVDFY